MSDLEDLEGRIAALAYIQETLIDFAIRPDEPEVARRILASLQNAQRGPAGFIRRRSRKATNSFVETLEAAISEVIIKAEIE